MSTRRLLIKCIHEPFSRVVIFQHVISIQLTLMEFVTLIFLLRIVWLDSK